MFIINSHNGYISEDGTKIPPIDINDYPAIKNWLDNGEWNTKDKKETNYERLAKRSDKGLTPYNLRSLAYMDDFSKPKILFSEMVQTPKFYLDKYNYFANDTVTFISGENLDYLIKFLNSKIVFGIFKFFYAGGGLGEKGIRVKKTFLQDLPIPQIPLLAENDDEIDREIQSILALSDQEIDCLVEI